MMILNIKTDSPYLNENLGISESRRVELSDKMDVMMARNRARNNGDYSVVEGLKSIGEICESNEEFAYCVYTHAHLISTLQQESATKKQWSDLMAKATQKGFGSTKN